MKLENTDKRKTSGTLITLFIVSISLNVGLISGWVKIENPAKEAVTLTAAMQKGYTEAERTSVEALMLTTGQLNNGG